MTKRPEPEDGRLEIHADIPVIVLGLWVIHFLLKLLQFTLLFVSPHLLTPRITSMNLVPALYLHGPSL